MPQVGMVTFLTCTPSHHSLSQIVQCIVSGKSLRAGQEPTHVSVVVSTLTTGVAP